MSIELKSNDIENNYSNDNFNLELSNLQNTILSFEKISISEYNNLMTKRDANIKKELDKFQNHSYENVTDYLEKTQKQFFLNSYKNNRNMVRNNINKIWDILKNKYGYKLSDDPIEILNTAIIQISQSGKIDNLSQYSNGINVKNFDINTINAHGFIEAHYKNLWQVSNGELSPTFNPSAIGWLDVYVKILEEAEKTTNYNQNTTIQKPTEVKEEKPTGWWTSTINLDQWNWAINLDEEKPVVIENKPTIVQEKPVENKPIIEEKKPEEKKKEDNWTINLDQWNWAINLDEEKPVVIENKPTIVQEKPVENKPIIEEKPAEEKPIIEEKKPDEKKKEDNWTINLDWPNWVINLDEDSTKTDENKNPKIGNQEMEDLLNDDEKMEEHNHQKKLEEIYENADEETKRNIENQIKWEKPNEWNINRDKWETINLDEWNQKNDINVVDINSPIQTIEKIDMFVDYDFVNELAQNSPIEQQRDKIQKLMDENKIVKDFVKKLEELWINFEKWNDTDVNRTSAILRNVNWNFEFGFEAVRIAKESNLKWAEAVKSIIFQTWAKTLIEDDNLKIVENMSWNTELLEKSLSKEKLNWVSYQEIIDVVWWFKDNELKKVFMYHLLNNDIISAQRVMWMELNCHSKYTEYKAGTKIWKSELQKIKKLWETRRYMDQNEIMANPSIPQDVKNAYMKFVNWEFNNKWKPYTILSKTDFNMYLFSNNHRLLSRQNVLIGSEVGDHPNNPMNWSRTTPGGLYEVWNNFEKSVSGENFFKKYWTHYIVLIPSQWQYKLSDQYTMWIHWTYENDPSRDTKIRSKDAKDRRGGTGCINLEDLKFGEAFNHLNIWWILFITYEPSSQEIEKFLAKNK